MSNPKTIDKTYPIMADNAPVMASVPAKQSPAPAKFLNDPWCPGDHLAINNVIYGWEEVAAVNDVLLTRKWFAAGEYVTKRLPAQLTKYIGPGHYLPVNSGTSALEVAIQTLISLGYLKAGDKVLHPATTFNTSVACFVKFGLIPVFADVAEGTYNIDPAKVEEAVSRYPDIKLVVIPLLIGNTPDITHLLNTIAESPLAFNARIILDSCDTIGTKWGGREPSDFAEFTAYSTYASHNVTALGTGGFLKTEIESLYAAAHSIAHWGRIFRPTSGPLEDFSIRYTYDHLGSDVQMNETQAAFLCAQLDRLPALNTRRKDVFARIHSFMQQYEDIFILPHSYPQCDPVWFGYPLCIRPDTALTRAAIIGPLMDKGLELRPLFSGNTMRQPAYQHLNYISVGPTPVADRNLTHAFFLPAWPMPDEALAFLQDTVATTMKEMLS